MTVNKAIEIVVENTSFATDYMHAVSIMNLEEKQQFFSSRKEFYKKRIAELRAERMKLLEK